MSGEAPLTFLLNMLKDEAIAFMNLKSTAKVELQKLTDELSQLEAHLKDAAEMYKKTNVFKENEKQIRKLVYEVQDTIEMCLTKKAASANTKNIFRKAKHIFSSEMEQKVRSLRQQSVAHALKLISIWKPPEHTVPQQPPTMASSESETERKYNNLSYDVKSCFLYTGLFPRNYEIPASTLTQLWIAEGFVNRVNGETLEESAVKVLKHLINEKLLRPEKMRLEEVKTCRLDDIIREFCIDKAMEQNLFTVIEPPIDEGQNLYRLCFHSDPSDFLSEQPKPNGPYVRSFLCLLNEPLYLDPKDILTIPNSFKPLRILNCESTKLEELPDIKKLILLKHVTLSIDKLDILPEVISQLFNLETLIVETKSRSIRVKANIWKMMRLRHLKTKVSFVLDDKKSTKGRAARSLQTLSRLSPKSCAEDLHEKAPKLKKLGIRGELVDLFKNFSLEKFTDLEKVTLVNYSDYGSEYKKPLQRLPDIEAFPSFLRKLSLSKTYLIWHIHMPKLANIHTLEVLKLKDNAFKGAWWPSVNDGFPSLRFLLIENTDLLTWEVSANHFPQLKWLVIKKCPLQEIPGSLKSRLEKWELD